MLSSSTTPWDGTPSQTQTTGVDDPLAKYRQINLAPMMDVTHRHFRYLCRLLSVHTLLYSEMVTTGAILHGPRDRLLAFSEPESPVALQLGGNDPHQLAQCAKIAQDYGYDEVNLNVGCPSDRVQSGGFGACLMAKPELVRDCLIAMQEAVDIPVTIKTRIGIDAQDSYAEFTDFIEKIKESPVKVIIVHARKAWLSGLNAKKNRQIPQLRYDYVYRAAKEHADRSFIINGGINSIEAIKAQLVQVQGVMIGREAQRDPMIFAAMERELFPHSHQPITRAAVLQAYEDYCYQQQAAGQRQRDLVRPLYGLFLGLPNAKRCRQILNELMANTTKSATMMQANFTELRNILNLDDDDGTDGAH